LPSHPEDLGGHTSLSRTLPFTGASVSTLALGGVEIASTSTGVDGGGFNDHTAILDELFDVRTRVGIADLSLLSRIEPDFAFADASDGGGETFLRAEIDWESKISESDFRPFCDYFHCTYPS